VPRGAIDDEGFYEPPGSEHHNIQLTGGGLLSRVTVRYFADLRPDMIAWVWMVEAGRRATPEEIQQLCAGTRPEF
jgi:hypothetical protein